MHSVGDTHVRLVIDPEASSESFPDALEFGSNHTGSWVKLPKAVLEAAFDRRVYGQWNDAPILVGQLFTSGPARGLVNIIYTGGSPTEAIAAGMLGDHYNGWEKEVDPAEVVITRVEITKREGYGTGLNPSSGESLASRL